MTLSMMMRIGVLVCGPLLAGAFTGAPRLNIVRPRATVVRKVASLQPPDVVPSHLVNKKDLPPLAPEDEWIGKLQLEDFGKEIRCVV